MSRVALVWAIDGPFVVEVNDSYVEGVDEDGAHVALAPLPETGVCKCEAICVCEEEEEAV